MRTIFLLQNPGSAGYLPNLFQGCIGPYVARQEAGFQGRRENQGFGAG